MSNLLPSLDASIDSHFSLDPSHTETTQASTAYHTSDTTSLHTSGTTSFHTSGTSSSCFHSDLGDSDDEEEMSASRRSRVSHKLKKAFGKISKKSSSSSGKKTNKLEKGKAKKNSGPSTAQLYGDDVSLDSTVPAHLQQMGSQPPPSEPATSDESELVDRRRTTRANKNSGRRATSSDSGPSGDMNSSSGHGRHQRRSRRSSTTENHDRSQDLKKARSFRRGAGGKTGKGLPPRSKSYGDEGGIVGRGLGNVRPAKPSRSASVKVFERQRGAAASSRSSNVTAKEAIPNPRPNLRRNPSERRQSSGRRPSKAMLRSRSFNKVPGPEEKGAPQQKDKSTAKAMRRSRSFNKVLGVQHKESSQLKEKSNIPRASSFHDLPEARGETSRAPRQRSTSRNRDNKKTNPALNVSTASAASCRHGEKLGECCYEHAKCSDKKAPPHLFPFDDHFGVEHTSDEISNTGATKSAIDLDLNNSNSLSQFLVTANDSNDKIKVTEDKNVNERLRRRSKSRSRSRSPSARAQTTSRRSKSRTRQEETEPNRRRSISLARNNSSERGQRSSEEQNEMRARSKSRARNVSSERGRRSSLQNTDRERSKSRARNASSERGRRSITNQNAERQRSTSRSKRGAVAQSKRGRSKSAHGRAGEHTGSSCRAEQQRASSHARRPSTSIRAHSRSKSNTRKEAPRKKYETLSKEDLDTANRRPRSLSRTRRHGGGDTGQSGQELLGNDHHARVSRSLSRTRASNSKDQHAGIGDYLQRKQPERKTGDDETNSHTTGTNTTGSHEVTYKTPSWMWSKANSSTNTGFLQSSFQTTDTHSLHNSFQTAKTNSTHTSFQTATSGRTTTTGSSSNHESLGSGNSYDCSCEKSSSNGSSFALTSVSGGTSKPEDEDTASMSSLSLTATPGTKAKQFYGKVMKKEQAELRAQSQQLFQNVASVNGGNGSRSLLLP